MQAGLEATTCQKKERVVLRRGLQKEYEKDDVQNAGTGTSIHPTVARNQAVTSNNLKPTERLLLLGDLDLLESALLIILHWHLPTTATICILEDPCQTTRHTPARTLPIAVLLPLLRCEWW
jgi:hypothetical protein